MNDRCIFEVCQASGDKRRYKCIACGFETAWTTRQKIVATCNEQRSHKSWITCEYRTETDQFIFGDVAGCGCHSSKVHVFNCEVYLEPVLKHASSKNTERIRAKIEGYNGRTCRTCDYVRG